MLNPLICAIQFLTTIPIHSNRCQNEKDLGRSMLFYPVVGLLIGIATLFCFRISLNFFTPAVSLVIAFVVGILITGSLHIDGFADMCDGFYAGKNKTEILAIMKDSHIGTMAVVGIFCLLLLKLSLLFSLLLKEKLTETFLIVPAVSRWVMTVTTSLYPYARTEEGTAKPFVENVGLTEVLVSSIFVAIISFYVLGIKGILVSVETLVIALIFMQWVKRKIGGITGDILGSLNEISEIAALFLLQLSFHFLERSWNI